MDFLWNNPDVAREMGKKAELRYWALFTADRMAKSYVSLYQKLLSQVK
jgi:rhamnosyl/mannosyltransferase